MWSDEEPLEIHCNDDCLTLDAVRNLWIVHFQWTDCMLSKLYFNKAMKIILKINEMLQLMCIDGSVASLCK